GNLEDVGRPASLHHRFQLAQSDIYARHRRCKLAPADLVDAIKQGAPHDPLVPGDRRAHVGDTHRTGQFGSDVERHGLASSLSIETRGLRTPASATAAP